MRVLIDWDLCQGHGVCMGEVPEVFSVDATGKLTLKNESPPDVLRSRIEVAVRFCPTGAISIAEGQEEAPCTR